MASPDDEGPDVEPGDPDYDLSEEYGYTWEPRRSHPGLPRWVLVVVTVLVLLALLVPALLIIARAS